MGSSDRETYTVEILEPTIKGQIYIQASKVKKIDIHTKTEIIIKFRRKWGGKRTQQ